MRALILILLAGLSGQTLAQEGSLRAILDGSGAYGAPALSEYPVETIYRGAPAPLDMSSEDARMFKTRLNAALADGVHFAGRYSVATFGCGTSCVIHIFIDRTTGKLLDAPVGGEDGGRITAISATSRLMVSEVKVYVDGGEPENFALFHVLLPDGTFKLVHRVRVPPQTY